MRAARLLGLAAAALAAVACSGTGDASNGDPASTQASALSDTFATSAKANIVPRDLLVAMAQVEGGLAMPAVRDVDPANPVPAAGPLALRRGRLDTLALGASLVGAPEITLRRDSDVALEAAARVLALLGARSGARADDLASWLGPIEDMSGYADDAHRRDYARRVFAVLRAGGSFEARDGARIAIAPHDVALPEAIEPRVTASAEYPGAEWFPTDCTGKCDVDRGGNDVSLVVIHDTEGGWDASVATLQNDAGKSVQYIVGTDGKVGQFVPESYTAWHAGNYWVNQRSVGIEHVGFFTKPYTEAQYAASARLVAYLAAKYGVAKDRAHVIGHDQVPNGNVMPESSAPCSDAPATCEASTDWGGAGNHRDPGDWEWPTYMPRFGGAAKCDDAHPLWNCSYDHTKAIRCAGGVVEVATCDGPGACESRPNGTNDVCHHAFHFVDGGEPVASATDAGPAPPGASGPASPASNAGGDGGAVAATSGAIEASADASAGCAFAPRPAPRGRDASPIALFFGLAAVAGRRLRTSLRRGRAPARA